MSWVLKLSRFPATSATFRPLPINPQVFAAHFEKSHRSRPASGQHCLGQPSALRTFHSSHIKMAAPVSSDPAGQLVQHGGKEYHRVQEGRAYILNPPGEAAASLGTRRDLKPDDESQTVFYNPIQQFNRDLSVLAIRAYGEHVLALRKEKLEKRRRRAQSGKGGRNKKRKREDDDEDTKQQTRKIDTEATRVVEGETQPQPAPQPPVEADPPHSFTILDALSATGLRALRYASEIPFTTRVVANDLLSSAIQSMKINIEYNQLEKLIQPNNGDARMYMYSLLSPADARKNESNVGKFDVIDLDPYGTAAPFLDGAVQAVKDGGLLCVTCTDAAVWASNGYPEKAFSLYGGVPAKGTHSHEAGLRLILNSLATSAAKYGCAIEPLLSLSIDFYARVFVRLHRSPAETKFISGNTMLVYNCDSGCGAWTTQPLTQTKQRLDKKGNPFYHYGFAQGPTSNTRCEHCGFKTHIAGPMWAGPLHNPHFVQKVLDLLPQVDKDTYKTTDRIEGMLTTALEEDLSPEVSPENHPTTTSAPGAASDALKPEIDEQSSSSASSSSSSSAIIPRMDPSLRELHPFYFSLSQLSKVLHVCTIPVDAFRGALLHLGYQCTRSHTKPYTTRTDAPWSVIWEIMREWVRQKEPAKEASLKPGTPGAGIMAAKRKNQPFSSADNNDAHHLASLKSDLLAAAAETGKDLSDLVTKIEAALYRSGARRHTPSTIESGSNSSQATHHEQPDSPDQNQNLDPANQSAPLQVVFDEALGREVRPKKRLVRYQLNPRANWGPLNRASGGT
ncbi:hypothetical protein ARAM_001250 [Aspergillus rambellii]|uniref:tRNA (guanine(26)-N(2))-dimethyltransferase n=1 Tax=Aspergillus rambellii TaxID=308745 RepID=A0A0F8V546_9EURO|nr:hypothetical protein ARAM_001250 [Aspergillus rambellii]